MKETFHTKPCLLFVADKVLFLIFCPKGGNLFAFQTHVVIYFSELLGRGYEIQGWLVDRAGPGLLPPVLLSRSPFICRLFPEDARSGGGDQSGSSSHSSLGVRLHHGGDRLSSAKCAGDGAGNKAFSQNNT